MAALLSATVVACGAGQTALDTDDIEAPIPIPSPAIAPETNAARGSVVSSEPVDLAGVNGRASRATYRSVSGIDGSAREITGVFVVPVGNPPAGGWPLISLAHGTTGIAPDCGPSQDPDLMGFLPTVRDLAAHGYAVAVTDYEGLGGFGSHPYLEPRSAAFNVADAARAIGNLYPNISDRWIALGNSQGGQAVWAVGEMLAGDGGGPDLAGVAALSPAANLTPVAQRGAQGDLTADQRAVVPLVVAGLERSDPALRARDFIDAAVRSDENTVFACRGGAASPDIVLQFDDPDDVAVLRTALRRIALPQQSLGVPMLVVNGLADNTIPASWVATAVREACALGGRIQHVEVAGAGHGDLGGTGYRILYEWIHDRIGSATPAPSTCGSQPQQVALG
ncbi:alpha/beta hydrolase family protein [Mycobacterium sp. C31M]